MDNYPLSLQNMVIEKLANIIHLYNFLLSYETTVESKMI